LKKVAGCRLPVAGLIIYLVYILLFGVHDYCYAEPSKQIRVAVLQDDVSSILKVNGPYQIIDASCGKVLSRGSGIKTTVAVYKGSILLGKEKFDNQKLLIRAEGYGSVISVDERKFRGSIEY